jgi:ribosome-associated protein
MSIKQQLQQQSNRLDKCRHSLAAAKQRKDQPLIAQLTAEIDAITATIVDMKAQQGQQLSAKGSGIQAMAFNRPLTKAEQGDMGKLKKTVRGLVVVHPMTALGRELGIKQVTGYAAAEF